MPASTTATSPATSSHAASGKRAWIKPAIVAAVLAVAAAGAWFSLNTRSSAPEVTFLGINGEPITPASLKGKVVMVNFWATSCTTCVAEMPQMIATYNKFKGQGLEFVAVAMSYDRPDYVLNYAATRKLPFKVALDTSGDAAKAYGDVALTPTTFLIDKDGKIIKRYVGQPEFAALHKLLDKALAG